VIIQDFVLNINTIYYFISLMLNFFLILYYVKFINAIKRKCLCCSYISLTDFFLFFTNLLLYTICIIIINILLLLLLILFVFKYKLLNLPALKIRK